MYGNHIVVYGNHIVVYGKHIVVYGFSNIYHIVVYGKHIVVYGKHIVEKRYFKQYSKQYMNVLGELFCGTTTEGLANI